MSVQAVRPSRRFRACSRWNHRSYVEAGYGLWVCLFLVAQSSWLAAVLWLLRESLPCRADEPLFVQQAESPTGCQLLWLALFCRHGGRATAMISALSRRIAVGPPLLRGGRIWPPGLAFSRRSTLVARRCFSFHAVSASSSDASQSEKMASMAPVSSRVRVRMSGRLSSAM